MITVIIAAAAGYFGFLLGCRWQNGQIELERDRAEELAFERGRRPGSIRLNTIRLRR